MSLLSEPMAGRAALAAEAPTHGYSAQGLSPLMHTCIGAATGMIECAVNQPLVGWKNAVQDKRPIPMDLRGMYRGVFINAGAFGPITAVQFGVNRVVEQLIMEPGQVQTTSSQKMTCALTAGFFSSVITSPAEMIMIQQQRTGMGLGETVASMYRRCGGASIFKRGFSLTATRDMIHCGGYLGMCPILMDYFKGLESFKDNQKTATVLGGSCAGVVVGISTHPFDTIKTRFQANIGEDAVRTGYTSVRSTSVSLYQEGGLPLLYAGGVPRLIRLIFAMNLLAVLKDKFVMEAEIFQGIRERE
mmetsp:Transcript_51359/g.164194  ORF Transcript_51359/g.164194 Transcript_51359/m.164194 type:complete len:302 (+) Transcript_51359:145-1050(+)